MGSLPAWWSRGGSDPISWRTQTRHPLPGGRCRQGQGRRAPRMTAYSQSQPFFNQPPTVVWALAPSSISQPYTLSPLARYQIYRILAILYCMTTPTLQVALDLLEIDR